VRYSKRCGGVLLVPSRREYRTSKLCLWGLVKVACPEPFCRKKGIFVAKQTAIATVYFQVLQRSTPIRRPIPLQLLHCPQGQRVGVVQVRLQCLAEHAVRRGAQVSLNAVATGNQKGLAAPTHNNLV